MLTPYAERMPEFPYDRLRRWPDVEADNLQAHDATDLLLTARALALAAEHGIDGTQIAVIGDEYGAITLALADAGVRGIRVHQDLATGRRALAKNAAELRLDGFESHELDRGLLNGARLVLLQLPKALAELEEIADAVARWAAPDAVLVAGGRVKHMTLAQNEVLARSFSHVQAQRAERKSRLIVASEPLAVPETPPFPVSARHEGLTLVAHGGAFAGARLDIGTRVLMEVLGRTPFVSLRSLRDREGGGDPLGDREEASGKTPFVSLRSLGDREGGGDPLGDREEASGGRPFVSLRSLRDREEGGDSLRDRGEGGDSLGDREGGGDALSPRFLSEERSDETKDVVLDLGCGTGALAVSVALAHPEAQVIATDRSAAAVASARATAVANGVADRVAVTHDDAASEVATASVDVVLLNPPFHLGTSVHTGAATRLFESAARVLRPGGELFTVFNSSLGYRAELTRLVGPTEQLHRTPKFTVTRSIRHSHPA
jgi:16S rRNA (guanine1207-N2)-methyltransferase